MVKGEDDEVEAILEEDDGDGTWEDAACCLASNFKPHISDAHSEGMAKRFSH